MKKKEEKREDEAAPGITRNERLKDAHEKKKKQQKATATRLVQASLCRQVSASALPVSPMASWCTVDGERRRNHTSRWWMDTRRCSKRRLGGQWRPPVPCGGTGYMCAWPDAAGRSSTGTALPAFEPGLTQGGGLSFYRRLQGTRVE